MDLEEKIFPIARSVMEDKFAEGGDPGISIVHQRKVSPAVIRFGIDAKR